METKKSSQVMARDLSSRKVIEFFGDLKQEFKNVSWTPRAELEVYTKIVVAATFLFGMLIYLIDIFIQGALSMIDFVAKLLGG